MRYRWIPRPYTVRDQVRYSWHRTSGLCRNTNTVGRRDWKIGSISLSFSNLSPSPSFPFLSFSLSPAVSTLPFSRSSPTRGFASYSPWLLPFGWPPLRYKYLPIISYLDTQVNITRQSDVVSPLRRLIHLDTISRKENRSPLFTSIQNRIIAGKEFPYY